MKLIIKIFSIIPIGIYLIVALLLSVIAVISLYDAVLLIVQMWVLQDFTTGIISVIYALLLTITIIVLFETVTVYFRTKHVEVRALLVAGITANIRHILVFNVASTNAMELLATVGIMAVLIAGIVLIKNEPE